jgi:hypothetical protein
MDCYTKGPPDNILSIQLTKVIKFCSLFAFIKKASPGHLSICQWMRGRENDFSKDYLNDIPPEPAGIFYKQSD